MRQCQNCFLDLDLYPLLDGDVCPNCGRKNATTFDTSSQSSAPRSSVPLGPGAPLILFGRFWATLKAVIFQPTAFFKEQAASIVSNDGFSSALAFAVIIQWMASFFNFVWRSTLGVALQGRMEDLFRIAEDVMETRPGVAESLEEMRHQAIEFLFGAGAIVVTPFTTLIKLLLAAILVHAAVRFFMKDDPARPHSYRATVKILAYSSAPWILCVIPGFGMLLAYLLSFVAGVIGLREVYRTTNTRAMFAMIFPELLFITIFLSGILLILFMAFNVLRLMF